MRISIYEFLHPTDLLTKISVISSSERHLVEMSHILKKDYVIKIPENRKNLDMQSQLRYI